MIQEKTAEKFYCTRGDCTKSYFDKKSLENHQNSHDNIKNFECKVCKVRFTTDGHLKDHARSKHSTERPYKCDVCDQKFARNNVLKVHKRTHNNEKPY